jgi:Tol biopolymer transport system component
MGSPINTEFEDTMPSATADGSRLYFNSDRPGGLGGFDIYEAILN